MFCNHCGSEIPDDALFCTNCGARLEKEEKKPEEPVIDTTQEEAPAVEEASACEAPDPSGNASGSYEPPKNYTSSFVPPQQPQPQNPIPTGDAPKDYLVVNIILTAVSLLSCCSCCSMISLITGIIGIVFSAQTRNAVTAGDLKTAQEKSKVAKIMWIISVVLLGVSLLVAIIGVASGAYASVMTDLGNLGW